MGSGGVIVLALALVALCIAGAGVLGGGCGFSWWKMESTILSIKSEEGLWSSCVTNTVTEKTTCDDRKDILKFNDDAYGYKEKDIILVSLIASTFFLIIAGFTSLFMFCCRNSRGAWLCSSTAVSICSFLAAGAAFGALGYAESEFEVKWKIADHGWSVIAGWIGASASFVAFILSIMLCCVGPEGRSRRAQHYPQTMQSAPQYNPGYEQGYPMK